MASSTSPRPNILLLVLDALRADAIEPYGAPAGSSPALAALADRGLAVSTVRSTASWTLPSHTAMFTGQQARSLGLGQAPGMTPQSAAPIVRQQRDRLVAELLRRAGYATKGATTNLWAGRLAGFDTGFEEFSELDTSRMSQLGMRRRERVRWNLEASRSRVDDGAAQAGRVMRRWLAELDERPFFWFVNLVECHSPYLPPKPFQLGSALRRMRVAEDAQRYLTFSAIVRTCIGASKVPEEVLMRMRSQYAASVRYVDFWVSQLVDAMADAGVLDSTLIIVCSDHGENLGENGLITHGLSLDERLLHVPFLVAGPGSERFASVESLVQLPAFIAGAAGLHAHPWSKDLPAGLPVAQWDPYDQVELDPRALMGLNEEEALKLTTPLTCAVSGDYKLVRGAEPGQERLYDLSSDPLESAPLTDERAMITRAGGALNELRAAVNHPAAQQRVSGRPAAEGVSESEVADIERRMRLMGYL